MKLQRTKNNDHRNLNEARNTEKSDTKKLPSTPSKEPRSGSSSEHSGLISLRMDWLALLAVQGTLKRLLQHHSSKVSILWHSAFFLVQISPPYMTTGKNIALTRIYSQNNVSALFLNLNLFILIGG